MKLKVAPNATGEWRENVQVTVSELELPNDPIIEVVTAEILLDQNDKQLQLDIDLTVKASTDCHHCGEPMVFLLYPTIHLQCIRVENPSNDSGDDDLKFIGLLQTEIDITQDLRDTIVLSTPMRITCCDEDKLDSIITINN